MTPRQRTADVLEPDFNTDRFSRIVNLSLIVLISLNVLAITLESVDTILTRYRPAFRVFEIFSVGVFTVEYLARVWSCIDQAEVRHRTPIVGRLRYIASPLALVDLAAILPFYLSLYLAVDLRFLRGLRLLRLFKLARYSPALGALLDVMRKEADTLLAAFVVLFILLMISAAGIYVLEHNVQPESFGSIPASMWWAIVTLTTLGYGDVVPVTTGGKILGGFMGVLGVGMIAMPAAILASGFADSVHARKAQYSRFAKHLLHDGVLDEHERWQLEELRKDLNIDSEEALNQLRVVMEQLKEAGPANCPHCGKSLNEGGSDS